LTLFGVTLKQQIEETKKELKEDLKENVTALRSELQNVVSLNSNIHPQFIMNPPPESQLSHIRQQIEEIHAMVTREAGNGQVEQSAPIPSPTQNTMFAFATRYQLENELRRIWRSRIGNQPSMSDRPLPITRIIRDLVEADLITPHVAHLIREVYAVGSAAVHGVEPTDHQLEFLRNTVPEIIQTLRAAAGEHP
jgi:hypothetical protein